MVYFNYDSLTDWGTDCKWIGLNGAGYQFSSLVRRKFYFFNVVSIVVFFEHCTMHISKIHVVLNVSLVSRHEKSGL